MRATIHKSGYLYLKAESDIESYALSQWIENNDISHIMIDISCSNIDICNCLNVPTKEEV